MSTNPIQECDKPVCVYKYKYYGNHESAFGQKNLEWKSCWDL